MLVVGVRNFGNVYMPENGTWLQTADVVEPRAWSASTVLLDGRVLTTGGRNPDGTPPYAFDSAELFDPDTP